MNRFSIPTRLASLALGLGMGLTLIGCTTAPAVRDNAGQVVESGITDVFAIKIGDCMDEQTGATEVSDVPTVPCGDPHDEEVFGEFTVDGNDFPGDDEMSEIAFNGCVDRFNDFIGLSYEESGLDFYPLTPTSTGWTMQNDRTINCVAYDPSAKTTGSLAGAAR
ncbi:septum formation family protein [Mycetocola spongiae]|uniref:septum formation family protein n=1 Tax=Mycetocola spongiae TaxID=2859226 RepID=UPI001CF4A4AB|nr:septum formation family protein [Mycetocola spongiae]UCR89603.1 septum formation family protein [Mycetocola spongiae]